MIAVVVGLGCSVAGAGLVLRYGSSMLLMDAVWHYTTWGAPAAAAANPAIGPLTVALALAIGVAGALLTYLLPMMRLLGGGESSERGRRRSRFLRNGMVEAYLIAAALLGIAIVISGFRFYMPEDSLRFQVTAEAVFKTTVLVLLAITPLAIAVGTVGLLTKSRLQLHSRIASLMTPRATSSAPSRRVQDLVFDGRRANAIAATTSLAIMTGVVASCGLVSYLAVTGRSTSDADYGGMRDMLAYTFFIATRCGIVVVGLLATEDSVRRRIQPDRPTAVPIAQADVRRAVVANSAASTTIGALVGVGAGLVGTLILATVMRYPEYEDPSLLYEPITMGFLEWVLPAVVIVIFGSAILAWVAVRPSDG